MNTGQAIEENVLVSVRNIGGISQTEVNLTPGVTILTGRNATNRTSLLQAIMLALGSDRASLKRDAESGEVELVIGDKTYTRTLTRKDGSITFDGEPFLDDPEIADLFAFLLEGNEARQAVARGDDLREIIMRPIDTAEIKAEIERLEDERREIDERLEEIEHEQQRLINLEGRRNELQTRIKEKRTALKTVESELESLSVNVEETREEKQVLESKLQELRETRSELEQLRRRVEREEQSINSLTEERVDVKEQLEELPDEFDVDTGDIQTELERLRERRRNLNTVVGELQNIVQFNEKMLEDDRTDIRSALNQDAQTDGSLTDRLLESKSTCWTCGSEVEQNQIANTLDQLRQVRSEKLDTIRTTEGRLEELKNKQQSIEENRQKQDNLESRLDQINDELQMRRERIEGLRDERSELESQLGTLEAEVESLESQEFNDILDKHKEANELEFELGQLQSDLDAVEDDIESVEALQDERESLKDEQEDVKEALADARTKIDQIETQAVEEFNDHMETVLDLLEYENIDRIWIERVKRTVQEGRRKVERSQFDLHIVRTNEKGNVYEDTINHLSESEREVTGLVFALAGYLVHEVYETLPFIILDSLEAIDSNRIASLVEYFSDYANYSVVALLPEDEAALPDTHQRISDI